MLEPLEDGLLPQTEDELTAQIAELEVRREKCDTLIVDLMNQEDHAAGVYLATEIHAAKQLKAMLQYQFDVRVAKRNRMRLGMEPEFEATPSL